MKNSDCCSWPIEIRNVGESGDPIRELYCTKCSKICDIAPPETYDKVREILDNYSPEEARRQINANFKKES